MVDWRANRLVDLLAKKGVAKISPSAATQQILKSITCLTRHLAAQLGQTTHMANHCIQDVTLPDGTVVQRPRRDSMDRHKCINAPAPRPPSAQAPET